MRICVLSNFNIDEQRNRLSRGSVLLHTSQLHNGCGTPVDVPVPKNSICAMVFVLLVVGGKL
jgi:hypothetical protein